IGFPQGYTAMVYLLLLLLLSASVSAMPEEDFARIRTDIFSVSSQSYSNGIEKIDAALKQYRYLLTLEQQIRLLYSKAIYQHRTNQTQAALVTLHHCKLLSEESADQSILYSYHNILAGIFADFGLYEQALQHYAQAVEKASFLSSPLYARQTENNIALILTELGQYNEARRYLERFYQFGVETDDVSVQAVALNNQAELALKQGSIKVANELHQRALALRHLHNLTHELSFSFLGLAKVARATANWQQCADYARQSLLLRQDRNRLDLLEPGMLLVEAQLALQQWPDAQLQLDQLIPLADELRQLDALQQSWQLQANLFEKTGQYSKVSEAWRSSMTAYAQLTEQRFAITVAQNSTELGLLLRNKEISELQQQHFIQQLNTESLQRQLWAGSAAALVIILLILWFSWKLRQKSCLLAANLSTLQQTQTQLVEAEKQASLSSLVVGMAHQLNTPLGNCLTAISSSLELQGNLQAKLDSKSLSAKELSAGLQHDQQLLQLAQNNINKAASLVERYKQIVAQTQESQPQQFDIKTQLQQQLPVLLQGLQPDYPVQLDISGDHYTLLSYPSLISQVLTALLENALLHGDMPASSARVSVDIEAETSGVRLSFSDNGKGISEDIAKRIFDPMFSTRLGQGHLGLGLNMVFNIMQKLHGYVQWQPQATAGCTFVLFLPQHIRHADNSSTD
ncbi:ATP-binding protein, partial [Rheinheimera baltica]|uniref:ATP-binding protein n=1 Tax=Rheinheimera baltica TaxID=67576 RepID=UPI00273E81E7